MGCTRRSAGCRSGNFRPRARRWRLPLSAAAPRIRSHSDDCTGFSKLRDRTPKRCVGSWRQTKPILERGAEHGPVTQAARQKSEDARDLQASRAYPVHGRTIGRDSWGGGVNAGDRGSGRTPPDRGDGCYAGHHRRGALLPTLRAVARPVTHCFEPIHRATHPMPLPHPDGRQLAKPLQEIPAPLPRCRDEITRELPSVMPARPPRPERKPINLPRSRRQLGMHTIREMSH